MSSYNAECPGNLSLQIQLAATDLPPGSLEGQEQDFSGLGLQSGNGGHKDLPDGVAYGQSD